MKTQKIALIMAGGVSLGSYEAGVLTELLYALETLNQTAEAEGRPRYELDIMTGGSAGGMTAALTARIMMYDLAGRRGHLYKAWVEDIDIVKLLGDNDSSENALFSKNVVRQIVQQYVVGETDQSPIKPASFSPETLHISLSLSNMHGIDYQIPYFVSNSREEQSFMTTTFSEMAYFPIKKNQLPSQEEWVTIGETAVATGNFPIAFKPQLLFRKGTDYADSEQEYDVKLLSAGLCFIDGGLFNNEPLGEAVRLAREADGGNVESDRLFILIDPSINSSLHQTNISPEGSLLGHVKRILTMVMGESHAHDWLKAHRKNTEIEWRDQFARMLGHFIEHESFESNSRHFHELKNLAETIVAQKRSLKGEQVYPEDYLVESLDRTFQQAPFKEIDRRLATAEQADIKRELFRYLAFVLNNVAGLQKKASINLALIGADKNKLAGEQLNSFGGFFNEQWRIYDYRIGRETAHALLPKILGLQRAYPKETDATGQSHKDYHIRQDWRERFPTVTLKDVDRRLMKALRHRILDRSNSVMRDFGIPCIFRWLLKQFVIRKKLNTLLKL